MKVKTKVLMGLLMILLFSMCTSSKKNAEEGLPVFDVADALNAALPDAFTWNSITKSVRMIPLKTERLIGGNPNVQYFSDDLIIVSDISSRTVFVFDGEGREKVSFCHYGPGPKEYLYMTRINYHEKDSLIMLYDGGQKKLFRFDLEGKFVDVRPTNIDGSILKIDSEGNMVSINRAGESLVSMWDVNFQKIRDYLPYDVRYDDTEKMSSEMMAGKGTLGDTFNVLPVLGDTIYSITKEGAEPFCVLDRGNYKCSRDDLSNMTKVLFNPDYLNGEQLYAFSSYFFYMTQMVQELWDMRTGKLLAWSKSRREGENHEHIWGFRYVFPSGHEVRPFNLNYVSKNNVIFILQADECLDDVEGLTADDNPVLVVLEL